MSGMVSYISSSTSLCVPYAVLSDSVILLVVAMVIPSVVAMVMVDLNRLLATHSNVMIITGTNTVTAPPCAASKWLTTVWSGLSSVVMAWLGVLMAWLGVMVASLVVACVSVNSVVVEGIPKQMSGAESLRKQVTPPAAAIQVLVLVVEEHSVRLFSVPEHSGTIRATSGPNKLRLTFAPGVVEPVII